MKKVILLVLLQAENKLLQVLKLIVLVISDFSFKKSIMVLP